MEDVWGSISMALSNSLEGACVCVRHCVERHKYSTSHRDTHAINLYHSCHGDGHMSQYY